MSSLTPSTNGVAVVQGAPVQLAGRHTVKLGNLSPALVIEDNYLASLDLIRLLDEWGIEARGTARIASAREIAREMRPRLALVDINLEGEYEGLALAHELQTLHSTRIVFVTGYHVRDLMHRMDGRDGMAVLFKPIDGDVLAEVLAKVASTLAGAN